MVFTKDISDLTFSDIQSLQTNKISESDLLDYKQNIIEDNDLLKHIAAFANASGGYIIFGVKESGRGGHPVSIHGIDSSNINKERIEQIVLSNITPRIHIRLHTIDHEIHGKQILIVQIPDSQYKPHYNNHNNKFYKRFQFEAVAMTEQEISDMYKSRFHTLEEVEEYLRRFENFLVDGHNMTGQIIVIPSSIDRRLIETSDYRKFEWLDSNTIDPKPSGWAWAPHHGFLPGRPEPFSDGLACKDRTTSITIHRNGCVQYMRDFGYVNENMVYLQYPILGLRIMHVLQFAQATLSRYNYFGDVRIRVILRSSLNDIGINHPESRLWSRPREFQVRDSVIQVDREFSTEYVKSHYSQVTASIMDEIFNHCGAWKCFLFDEDGNYKMNEFSR